MSASFLESGNFTVARGVTVSANANTNTVFTLGFTNLTASGTYSGAVQLNHDARLSPGGTGTAVYSGIFSGTGGLNLDPGSNGGSIFLTASNTFTGLTTLSSGTNWNPGSFNGSNIASSILERSSVPSIYDLKGTSVTFPGN